MGIHAIHVWRIEPGADKSIVRTEESWEGLLVRILRRPFQKQLETAVHTGLGYLKAEAERRAQKARVV